MIGFLKKYYSVIIAPLITAGVLLFAFSNAHLYPFGKATVAWCDMNYQVVPMLMDFRDILVGNDGLFLNMHNASGMNFWGVFCFFLSSPFSFLVLLTEKQNILFFVNILVLLKMSASSLTAALYFRMCKKGLSSSFSVVLGVMYGLCGYGMMFFQNIMWLDIMYMFPLLLIGLDRIVTKKKNLLYIIFLSLIMIMNFYIGYMIVIFLLLYMALYIFRKDKKTYSAEVPAKFLSGSVIAALITAVIWLPSLIQTTSSGRLKSLSESLSESSFLTSYTTILPLLMCSAFIFVLAGYNIMCRKNRSLRENNNLIIFCLMLVPFIIEPVNLMWHTGDYMSFPARYGFITVFAGLICCADVLSADSEKEEYVSIKKKVISFTAMIILISGYYYFSKNLINDKFKQISRYTYSLWGDGTSFELIFKLFVFCMIVYAAIYVLYHKKYMIRPVCAMLLLMLCFIEGIGNSRIYLESPSVFKPYRTIEYADVVSLSDKINDDSFYRVTTDNKTVEYNLTGAMGYNSLSHYSSLDSREYMAMQRQLGYSTVWMKAGSLGGTELTDSLYCVKYRIKKGVDKKKKIVSSSRFSIEKNDEYYNGLGIICDSELLKHEVFPEKLTRAQIQEYLFENIYGTGEKLVTEYNYDKEKSRYISNNNGIFKLEKNAVIRYTINVKGRQSLYADCYNGFSNDLKEDFFDALRVKVNGVVKEKKYPNADKNGLLYLGEFKDRKVTVEITSSQSFNCSSFGVFGLDLNALKSAISQSECAALNYDGSKISGSVQAKKGQCCFLSVPYNDGLIVKINGENVPAKRVMSDLTAFELKEGKNDVEITLIPKGFIAGLLISLAGIAAAVLYTLFIGKLKLSSWIIKAAEIIIGLAALVGMFLVYVFPMIFCAITYK